MCPQGKQALKSQNVASETAPEIRHCHRDCLSVFNGWNYIWMINKREILKYFQNGAMRTSTLRKKRMLKNKNKILSMSWRLGFMDL